MKKLTDKLICIDIETTDLNPDIGSVIQIGAVKVNSAFKHIRYDNFVTYIKPLTKHRALGAMKCNKISEDTLINATGISGAALPESARCSL